MSRCLNQLQTNRSAVVQLFFFGVPFWGPKITFLIKVDRCLKNVAHSIAVVGPVGTGEKAEHSWRGLLQASVGIRLLCGFPAEASVSTGFLPVGPPASEVHVPRAAMQDFLGPSASAWFACLRQSPSILGKGDGDGQGGRGV